MAMEQGRFAMKDHEFFGDPETGLAAGVRALMKESFRGIALDAPRVVTPSERNHCPVLLAQIDLARKLLSSPVDKHCVLIATDLKRHRTYAALAIEPRNSTDDDAPIDLPSPTQVSGQSYQVDLRERLGLPWDRGELRVQVVSRDQVSNRVAIRLGASDVAYRDEVAEAFIESQWAQRRPPAIHPPRGNDPLPSYRETPHSPAIPEALGLRVEGPRVVKAGHGASVVLHGSFRVPKSAVQRVLPEHRDFFREPIPTGIVNVGLLLTGSVDPGPEQMELHVPIDTPLDELERSGEATGWFAFDLAKHVGLFDRAQTWFLYGFCDELTSGPTPIAIVLPDQLPT